MINGYNSFETAKPNLKLIDLESWKRYLGVIFGDAFIHLIGKHDIRARNQDIFFYDKDLLRKLKNWKNISDQKRVFDLKRLSNLKKNLSDEDQKEIKDEINKGQDYYKDHVDALKFDLDNFLRYINLHIK